jgi:hypothetical protein
MNVDIGGISPFRRDPRPHDAVLVATGVYKARDIKAPGVGHG